jgi:RES domain-containing protein
VQPTWFQTFGLKRGPLNFNPRSSGRFNAPAGEYGTTYLSTSVEGAFAEKFLQSARHAGRGVNVVTRATLALHCLCPISQPTSARPLRLVGLTGNGPAQIGADGRLSTMTDDPGLTQRRDLCQSVKSLPLRSLLTL